MYRIKINIRDVGNKKLKEISTTIEKVLSQHTNTKSMIVVKDNRTHGDK